MSYIFTSLGLFIIDENRYAPKHNRPNDYDIIGGGATYACVGGRMVAGPSKGKLIGGIFDKGSDFLEAVEHEIVSWGTGVVLRPDMSRLTSRGVNVYDDNDVRTFHYVTPKKRIEVADIMATGNLANSRSFHFCCAVDRCEASIDSLKAVSNEPRAFIFEPTPDACVKEHFQALSAMLHKVDVFLPNLEEAMALTDWKSVPRTEAQFDELADTFFRYQDPEKGGTVLRCGPLGCYIKSKGLSVLLPAYHLDQEKVVDVTGGGNSFCGAFMTALVLSRGDWLIAGVFGNLISGAVIEKLGPPAVEKSVSENWNGSSLEDRLKTYIQQNKVLLLHLDRSKIDWR